MRKILLFLSAVCFLGLAGCDMINQQMQQQRQTQQPAKAQSTAVSTSSSTQKSGQNRLINGPLGSIQKK